MALARLDYHVALGTAACLTSHVNFKEPVTKPLFHFIREAVECRPQLRPHTWAINAIHELFPGKPILPVT